MASQAASAADGGATFFGHPRGLSTLFFTELWERFSYYGMRALLVLFLVDAVNGGFGMNTEKATAIVGLYTFGVYALALPGGWLADRLIGQKKAVLYGGVLIAAGHYALAIPASTSFYVGLFLIVVGTGLLKPNVSAIVGDLYEEKGAKRDAGFSIFYMGINIGAILGPLICSFLGEPSETRSWVNWHYGFGAAGVGMTFAVIAYIRGAQHLRGAGELKEDSADPARLADARRKFVGGLGAVLAIVGITFVLNRIGMLEFTLVEFNEFMGKFVVILAALYFTSIIVFACKTRVERQRVGVIALLFLGAALFWSGFEQAATSFNIFAFEHTDRVLGGIEIPAGVMQIINPTFIVLLAPVMGMLWVWLDRRSPSIPVKFGYGLVLLGVGFLVLAWGSTYVEEGKVGIQWLLVTYFFHTVGELCLSPVGLSSVTKLAPDRLVGQMMGTWFVGAALGNLIAGQIGGKIEHFPLPQVFGIVAGIVIAGGVAFFIISRPVKKLTHGID